MDVVKEDKAEVEVTEEDTEDRSNWRWKIRCGDLWWEKPKEEEEDITVVPTIQLYWNGQLVWTPALPIYTGMDNKFGHQL